MLSPYLPAGQNDSRSFVLVIDSARPDIDLYESYQFLIDSLIDSSYIFHIPMSDTLGWSLVALDVESRQVILWYDSSSGSLLPMTMNESQTLLRSYHRHHSLTAFLPTTIQELDLS